MKIPQAHGDPHPLDPSHNRMLYALLKRRRDQRSQGWASIGELMVETRSTQQEVVAELRALFAHYKLESIAGNGIVTNRYRLDPSVDIKLEALPEPQPRVRPKPEPVPDDAVQESSSRSSPSAGQPASAAIRADVPPPVRVPAENSAASSQVREQAGAGDQQAPKRPSSESKAPQIKAPPKKPQTRVAIALVDAVRIGQQAVEVMLKEAPPVRVKTAKKPGSATVTGGSRKKDLKVPTKKAAKKSVPAKATPQKR